MMYGIKRFIRSHKRLMYVLALIYRFLFLNHIKGRFNVKLSWGGVFVRQTSIINRGKNNRLIIGEGCRVYHSKISFSGNGNRVKIGDDCELKEVDIVVSNGGVIEVGDHTHFTGKIHIACTEGRTVHIGNRCLFSSGITFRTGDSHSIFNESGLRINSAKDIFIGDHVWFGQNVTVLKGSIVNDDSIIGTGTIITGKKFGPKQVIAGSPAKVIKENVNWDPKIQ